MRAIRVVIVAYHGAVGLDRCLTHLGDSIATTVVDNSSSRAVKEVALSHGAEYIDPDRNLGFGAGVNVALRRLAAGEPVDILLLNPDAVITQEDVRLLAERLHRPDAARVGAVAPLLVDNSGGEHRVMWPQPSPLRAWLDACGLGRFPGRTKFAVGAVLLLRWEAVCSVGLFDERFFLYAEEADWQRRAAELNWRSELCTTVIASHVGAATSVDRDRREELFHAGQETYIRKWYGPLGWLVYRSAVVVGAAIRTCLLRGERRVQAASRLRLYARGPRRAAGFARTL